MFQLLAINQHVSAAPTKEVVSWGVPGRLDMSGVCAVDVWALLPLMLSL